MNTTTKIMKSLKSLLLVVAILGYTSTQAQSDYFSKINPAKKFSAGINLGLTNSFTDAPANNAGNAFGLNVKYSLSHTVGLRASFALGSLVGDRSDNIKFDNLNSYSFENNFSAIDLSAVFTLGNISFLRPVRNLQYFATVGIGSINNDAEGTFSDPADIPSPPNNTDDNKYTESSLFIPIGLGLSYNLNENFDIGLNSQFNFTSSDDIDGFNYNAC
jgi:OOP family OmpA-OmpF porin